MNFIVDLAKEIVSFCTPDKDPEVIEEMEIKKIFFIDWDNQISNFFYPKLKYLLQETHGIIIYQRQKDRASKEVWSR